MQVKESASLPLISILINNYNYGRFLGEAIESALQQTYPHIEIIVVDDGSTDHSREIIATYGDRIIPILKANGGQASAYNAGFAASRGEIICFLDADDLFVSEKAAAIADVLKDYKESSWCFHPLQMFHEQKATPQDEHRSALVQAWDLREDMKQGGIRDKQFLIPPTSGLCFTRSLLQQILPMPEEIRITSDSYLQFTALTMAKGFSLSNNLSMQRIHGANAYTGRTDRKPTTARINCLTAYWMRKNVPDSFQFTHNLFASGLSAYWHVKQKESYTQEIIDKYLLDVSLWEKFKIYLRTSYYYFMKSN